MLHIDSIELDYDVYVSDDFLVIRDIEARKWKLVDKKDLSVIDSDQFRNSLAERNNLDLYGLSIKNLV